MNNTDVMVDVSETLAQSSSKKNYVAPTGPQDLSVHATKATNGLKFEGAADSTTS